MMTDKEAAGSRRWRRALVVATGLWVGCSPRAEIGVAEPDGTAGKTENLGNVSMQAGAPPTSLAGRTGGGSGAGGGAGTGDVAGLAGDGGADGNALPLDPYEERSGSFKMLVYSRTENYRHASIPSGKKMLQQIADEQGFEVVMTETNELVTLEGLAPFEIVFFMNTSGDVFSEAEQHAFEEWMTTRHGAFGGVHAATNTEQIWPFYSEVTGQYYDGHGLQGTPGEIVLEAGALNHPAVQALPNPWKRDEEWFKFDSHLAWTAKPGFQVLGRKSADGQPIAWVRQWGNFRSFYTGLGHDQTVFEDTAVKQHVTGGIMWAVRREHLIR